PARRPARDRTERLARYGAAIEPCSLGTLLGAALLGRLLLTFVALRTAGFAARCTDQRFEIVEVPRVVDAIVPPHASRLRVQHESALFGGTAERVAGVLMPLRLRRRYRQEQ